MKQQHEVMGYTFKSDADLSRQLGKYTTYVNQLRRKGWTYEKIISHVLDPESQEPQITISGYTFKNNADLSDSLENMRLMLVDIDAEVGLMKTLSKTLCSKPLKPYLELHSKVTQIWPDS